MLASPVLGLVLLAAGAADVDPAGWPLTRPERTDYQETSHHTDVEAFLFRLQEMGAPVRMQALGETNEGRKVWMAIASRPPISSPAEARRTGKPIIYVQGNIHAGEVEGKEAALMLLRRASQEPRGILERAILLVVPNYNADGNERWGPVERNRPGQVGPTQVGIRANAQGFDLNRDAVKAESPEMRALLEGLYTTWDPDVVIDLHTTNGTRHGFELTYSPPLHPNTDPGVLRYARDELLPSVRRNLRRKYGMETFDYGNSGRVGQQQAWQTFAEEGRYVTNYAGLRGRIGVLSEATSFIPFRDRIVATDRFLGEVLDHLMRDPARIVRLTREADARTVAWGLQPSTAPELGVRFEMASRGVEAIPLERPRREGEPRASGRPAELVTVRMPIYDRFRATRTARFPAAYLIPADQKETVDLLRRHGVFVETLAGEWRGAVERFEITEAVVAERPFQGRRMVRLEGRFAPGRATFGEGAYLVRTAQPLGILAFHVLEPEGLDGAAAWGFMSGLQAGATYPAAKVFEPVRAPAGG
jgi:hypothetical protein